MASLISLSGCSRFALSSVCVGSLVVLGLLLFGGSFVGGFSPPVGILMLAAPTYFLCVAGGFLPPTLSHLCLIARVVITEGLERLWQGQGQQLLQLPLAEAWCFLLHPLALVSSLLKAGSLSPLSLPLQVAVPVNIFYDWQLILLNSFTFFTHLPKPSHIWQPSISSFYLCLFLFSELFISRLF